ncbi:ZYRO0D08250p [Zygosaccharomyces rouxii]|uniref:Mannosyltransferase n=2 Tax=Zygosaccharomyces rouxii TaxID=4956 RepID=C5DVP0_ZYGRC|nr:uncharacterized protein ZYRO0D08250g [Zygosaccharomyces rouxii]KAH9200771.1 Dolichyl-P-Man:Man(7)GlcNAc(2)-PP-dolichyl-alpha-1,6-mannosyltransferase [Zygosaccharomyces rouxii]CAQ43598.1 Dolichyl-P-Man:Man(7)GlcNAc(2)-PP-dolichyl-alpha-1,6-mannosyltransferase [Zygosaccharomyces rouxii]CAR27859.1 ZYRO0D08250p [Zygosaccharomyces rouxii]
MGWSYLDYGVILLISIYLRKAPFTKVEESFSIQAVHDILNYGILDISRYDHLQFPGVVPRSFIGPLIIAALTKPFTYASSIFSANSPTQFEWQLLTRAIIGLTNWLGLMYLKNCGEHALETQRLEEQEEDKKNKEEGRPVAIRRPDVNLISMGSWFTVNVLSQFHLIFYSSRPLPNFVLTLPLTNVALGWVLLGNYKQSVFLLAFTAIIFRLEVAALCAGVALLSIFYKKLNWFNAIKFGLMGGIIGMGLTLTVDSYFWRDWCIPEVDAFIFNVIRGKSAEWGIESPAGYFTHYLRTMFVPPTILLMGVIGFRNAPKNIRIVSLAAFFHIFVLSFQPHKEWRFIIYSIPPIILLGSTAAAYIWENLTVKKAFHALIIAVVGISPLISLATSFAFLHVSSMNYPGGQALTDFNEMIIANNITNVTVHMNVPVCMTGVTRFGELDFDKYGIIYDKTEDLNELKEKWNTFDYLIDQEGTAASIPFEKHPEKNWEQVSSAQIFIGLDPSVFNGVLKENETPFDFIYRLIKANVNLFSFFSDLIDSAFLRDDIFYTYRRISHDEDHAESQ